MILVKVGGSVLTNKGTRGRPRFNRAVATRLLRELQPVLARHSVALVHGAGSFAHPLAMHYRIGKRKLAGGRLLDAVTRTQAGVRALRAHVLDACLSAKIPAIDVPVLPLSTLGREAALDASPFAAILGQGFVPVTGGDLVFDAKFGVRVLSGDEIVQHLAKALGPKRAVFVSDVDGVLQNGRTVDRLSVDEATRLLPRLGTGHDATGGMRGKVEHAIEVARLGVPVTIVNGRARGRLTAACLGRATKRTLIAPA